MVAYRAPEKHTLSPNEKQELLLIRCSLEPIPKAGNNEMCNVISDMVTEIKAMLMDPYLFDAEGRVLRANEASGLTIAQHFGNIDLESMVVMGPEEAMFFSYADIRHEDRPSCMSISGLSRTLHEMHADKSGQELVTAFKVADLNGDGEIDLDEFLFAVKIKHGAAGFEKGQYFITFSNETELSDDLQQALVDMLKGLKHPLSGSLEEVIKFGRTESAKSHLSFKGKSLETGQMIQRVSSVQRMSSQGIQRIPSEDSWGRQQSN